MLNRNIGFGYTTIIIVISTTDGLGGRHRRSSSWTEAVREMTARNYSNTKTSRTFFTIFIHSVHNLILLIINEIKQQKNLKSLFLVSRSKTAESLWRAGISITTLIPHQHQCSARSEARVKSRTCWYRLSVCSMKWRDQGSFASVTWIAVYLNHWAHLQ